VLTPQAKRTLKFAVTKVPKNGNLEIEIIGAVQKSANSKNIDPLGSKRAMAVKLYLQSLRVSGKFNIRAIGVVGNTSKARRADTTIIYS
jgi:outer membrane protein OmpA-like peptidoglycan-associated protein